MSTLHVIDSLGEQNELLTQEEKLKLIEYSKNNLDFLKIHALGVRFKVLELCLELEEKYYYLTEIKKETETETAMYCRIRIEEELIKLKDLNEAETRILDELYENYEDIY